MYVLHAFLRAISATVASFYAILVQLLREQSFLPGKEAVFVYYSCRHTRSTSMVLDILVVEPSKRIWVSINTAA